MARERLREIKLLTNHMIFRTCFSRFGRARKYDRGVDMETTILVDHEPIHFLKEFKKVPISSGPFDKSMRG